MYKYFFLFILLNIQTGLFGQVKIYGKITDINGVPVKEAKIYLEGSYDETTSLPDGSYQLTTTEKGKRKITAHIIGYFEETKEVTIYSTYLILNFQFTMREVELQSVEITSDKNMLLEKESEIKSLSSLDINTTATDGNFISAFKLMPGVQQIGESGELFARGGAGSETKLYIDGMLVSNYLKSGPPNQSSSSRFPASLFNNTQFNAGGYPSQYGQALSSVMLLETTDLPYKNEGNISLSPIFGGGDFNLLNKKGTASWGASYTYTNLSGYMKLFKPTALGQHYISPPVSHEGSLKYTRKTFGKGLLKVFASYGNSSLAFSKAFLDYPDIRTTFNLKNDNFFSILKWEGKIKQWSIDFGYSWSINKDKINTDVIYSNDSIVPGALLKQKAQLNQAKLLLNREIGSFIEIGFGGEFQSSTEYFTQALLGLEINDNLASTFCEVKYYPLEKITSVFGLRYEHSSLLKKNNISPRFQLIYSPTSKDLLSFTFADYYQKPFVQYIVQGVQTGVGYEKSTNYTLSYQRMFVERLLKGEIYYKKYDNLVRTVSVLDNSGHGHATGAELFIKDKATIKGLEYWLSYSYIDSKRLYLSYPHSATPPFVANHTATLVVKKYFKKPSIIVSPSYSFATGRPYYNPNRPTTEFLSDKTISYNNLSINIAHLTKIRGAFTVLVLTVNNILGIEQVYGYSYSSVNTQVREAIKPLYKRFIFVGIFLNFGIDKRNQIIDEQL